MSSARSGASFEGNFPGDRPATGELEMLRNLLNSDDRFHGFDHAESVASFQEYADNYLAAWQPLVVDTADLAHVREARDVVRRVLVDCDRAAVEELNTLAASHPVRVQFRADAAGSVLQPTAGTVAKDAVARIVATIHLAIAAGDWQSLRSCERDDCGWIYFDASPGRRGRWCTLSCGSVMKTRAYRQRTRASAV
jgi:predicted RNA-binding Zn ribbon-like protein